MNDSPSTPMTFSIEVEPSVATLPFSLSAEQALITPRTSARTIVMIFFIEKHTPFLSLHSFSLPTIVIIPESRQIDYRRNIKSM